MNKERTFVYSYNTPTYSYYYYTAAVFCCVHIHRSPAVARPPPLFVVLHGYTQQQQYQVGTIINTVPYLVAVCINTAFSSPLYLWCTATGGMYYFRNSCSPAVARPPPLLLVVQQYTASVLLCWYIIIKYSVVVAVPPGM